MNVRMGSFSPKFGMALPQDLENRVQKAQDKARQVFQTITQPYQEQLTQLENNASSDALNGPDTIHNSSNAEQQLKNLTNVVLSLKEALAKAYQDERLEERPSTIQATWGIEQQKLSEKVSGLAKQFAKCLTTQDANALMQYFRNHREQIPLSVSEPVFNRSTFTKSWITLAPKPTPASSSRDNTNA